MSEVWISRKKWTCKYCDVTINDDVPSRQQHENGLRHKGNVERQLRQAYKKSEKDRREEKDAKREMEKIERLAQQSHAKDLLASGSHPSITTTEASAESSKITKEEAKVKGISAWKPKDRLAAYGSALPLHAGGSESVEDEEKVLKEWQERQEARRKEGTAGQWESVVTPSTTSNSARAYEAEVQSSSSLPKETSTSSYIVREKQGHFRQDDDNDVAAAEIKVKKRLKVNGEAEKIRQAEEESRKLLPSWTPLRLDTGVGVKKEGVQGVPVQRKETQKVDLIEEGDTEQDLKEEVLIPQEPIQQTSEEAPSTSLFKKRKAGAGVGAKRVRAVI